MSTLTTAVEFAHESKNMIFPSSGMQVLSAFAQFLGISIMAHCLSRRLAYEELSSLRGWKDLGWPRLCVLLVFLDSWLFLFTCGVLIFGVGLERGSTICSLTIYLCIAFYGTSKFFIYCYLIEKVHVVWAPAPNKKRFRSPVYIACCVTVALYAVVATLMYIGRVHYFREDGACVTGVELYASIPLLSYDLFVNIFLTSLFLWPLIRTGKIHPLLRRIARRTLLAATVALTTSTINVLVLTLQHGQELGWVCLGSCGADVVFNALALFWVTERSGPHFSSDIRLGSGTVIGAVHDAYIDGNSKTRSRILRDLEEPFPSLTPNKNIPLEERGHRNQRQEFTRNNSVCIALADQDTTQPSPVRLNSPTTSSSSKMPWAAESVSGFFRRSQDQQREPQQLEIKITTEREVVEDTVDPRQYSRTPIQHSKSPHPSSNLEHT